MQAVLIVIYVENSVRSIQLGFQGKKSWIHQSYILPILNFHPPRNSSTDQNIMDNLEEKATFSMTAIAWYFKITFCCVCWTQNMISITDALASFSFHLLLAIQYHGDMRVIYMEKGI